MTGTALFWTGLGFLLGSMPFSLWLGHLLLRADVRRYGDGNPGATNAWRAGGWRVGLLALCLDYLKGAVPVGLAHFNLGVSGWGLVTVALAPVLGHAFSPFLRFRGGKALAATFGIWTGLTLGEGPIILGLLLGLFLFVQDSDGWAVLLGMLVFGGHLVLQQAGFYTMVIWGINTLLLAWKYRHDLGRALQPRPWVGNLLRQSH
jgi:glycerol-3-phosphate acyltransferase PlsY